MRKGKKRDPELVSSPGVTKTGVYSLNRKQLWYVTEPGERSNVAKIYFVDSNIVLHNARHSDKIVKTKAQLLDIDGNIVNNFGEK